MGNHSKENRRKKKKEIEINFIATKESCVAGIVVILTILKNVVALFWHSIPSWCVFIYSLIVLAIFWLVLGTRKLDHLFKRKGAVKFGSFLTVASIIVFLIENLVIEFKDIYEDWEIILITVPFGLIIIVGAIYLWLDK